MTSTVTNSEFGTLSDGRTICLYTLDSHAGCQVKLSEFGATITSVLLADGAGKLDEVCLGYDTLKEYENDSQSIGVTVGRYANRIAFGKFHLNGKEYKLDTNIPPHQIHGGSQGFGKQAWRGETFKADNCTGVKFHRTSRDGECGYPGNLDVTVTYSLSTSNNLSIEYSATSDLDTFVNLTNHAYFNLSDSATVSDHVVTIHSEKITPLDKDFIVTGQIETLSSGPFDLRSPRKIGEGLANQNDQMKMVGGYDINYIIGKNDGTLKQAAYIANPKSGHSLKVSSTQPCLQFYTGNNLAGTKARDGSILSKHAAFCVEAQDYPNGPNISNFPTLPLRAGEIYRQRIDYDFGSKQ